MAEARSVREILRSNLYMKRFKIDPLKVRFEFTFDEAADLFDLLGHFHDARVLKGNLKSLYRNLWCWHNDATSEDFYRIYKIKKRGK